MARAVVRLFSAWHVDGPNACAILNVDPSQWKDWQQDRFGEFDDDLTMRLVILIQIHTRLRVMFTDRNRGYAWVHQPNATFEGRAPIEILASGDVRSLLRIRDYLEAESS
jgi:hypothetical protein